MGTVVYQCGCSITRTMGEDNLVSCYVCDLHAKLAQTELAILADKIFTLQKATTY